MAFFACMYYGALSVPKKSSTFRAVHLTRLPERGWGEMELTHSEPRSRTLWTDSGKSREPSCRFGSFLCPGTSKSEGVRFEPTSKVTPASGFQDLSVNSAGLG